MTTTRRRTATAAILIALAALIGITGCATTTSRPANGSCWSMALAAGVEIDFYWKQPGGSSIAGNPNNPLATDTRNAIAKAPLNCDPLIAQYRATKAALVRPYQPGVTGAAVDKWHAMADSIQM